jgi:peptide-methionine (S)-S-oxide reductase
MATAIFGGGCFWCTEAVFDALAGVSLVEPGYCGGHVERPTYEQICGADTGHIEVIRIEYDPAVISYEVLLEIFFATHDPTTPNQQGNDVGPQYQSAVFYQDDQQKTAAEAFVAKLDASGVWPAPVCTKILPDQKFWIAEGYHHDYFANHPQQGYCQFVIAPKVSKLVKLFGERLKSE